MATHVAYYDLKSPAEVQQLVASCCVLSGDAVSQVTDPQKLQQSMIWTLQFNASVNADAAVKQAAIQWIERIADALRILPASNFDYYAEKASGKNLFATTPAINSRMVTFHTVRAALQAANHLKLPHVIFELALSERTYTDQKMNEYSALVKAAYISHGMRDCKVYLQGDHYQVDPAKYAKDAAAEKQRIKDLIAEALAARVCNIDIDTSKFETVDPAKNDRENQALNAELAAEMLYFIRCQEAQHKFSCTISVGGEVGEVGGTNTKYPQVNAYLELVKEHVATLAANGPVPAANIAGLSKISINVGSAHGGQLGPDGKPLHEVPLDFQAHHDLFTYGKDPMHPGKHVLSVQHGASTLPKHYFALFPAMHVAEIHLATGFQNIVWDTLQKHNPALHAEMRNAVLTEFGDKVKKHPTEAVGIAKECKNVTKLFKRKLLEQDFAALEQIEAALLQEFTEIMHAVYVLLQPKNAKEVQGDRAD